MAEKNLRLLYKFAVQEAHRRGKPLGEYLSVGWEAMVRAAMSFDPEIGRYSTIAVRSILNAIADCEKAESRHVKHVQRYAERVRVGV